ncbi:hypothetical protein ACNKHV_10395 [Shigella flexneri]
MRGRFVEGLGGAQFAERLTLTDCAIWRHKPRKRATLRQWRSLPTIRLMCREISALACTFGNAGSNASGGCAGGRFLAANCYSIWRKVAKKCWSGRKRGITRPEVFHALTTALRREPRLRFR